MASLRVRTSSTVAFFGLALLLLTSLFAAPPARAQFTTPIDIPSQVGGQTTVISMSKNGIVAGTDNGYYASAQCLFTWQNGVQNEFDCTTGYYPDQMVGVNNAGVIAGNYGAQSGGFTWTSAGGVTPLTNLPFSGTDPVSGHTIWFICCDLPTGAIAINNNGDVVGYANVEDITVQAYFNEAVFWPAGGGSPVYLGPFTPIAINDSGQVMGLDSSQNGYVWTQSGGTVPMGDLGVPGTLSPTSMNSSGQITGAAQSAANGGNWDFFLWSGGAITDLGGTCSACTNFLQFAPYNTVINDSGDIAGFYYDTNGNTQSLIWTQAGGFQPLSSFGVESVPMGINASGQIAGWGNLPNGGFQGVYWANSSAAPLDMGAGQINFLSDNGWAAGVDSTGFGAAAWNLTGTPIGGPPVITITSPANNATYQQGQAVGPVFSCSATVGISSCTGQDSLGDVFPQDCSFPFCVVNTNTPGNFTFTVTGTTNEGVTGTYTVNYTVASASQPVTGAKMRGYGALAADQQGDLYRFTMNVEDTQQGAQAGRFDLWTVDINGYPKVTNTIDADSITSVNFTNTGLLGANKKGQLLADTVTFTGTGEYNDQPGYTITVTATDAGNPGVGKDSMNIAVTDSNNNLVFSTSGLLDAGNIFSTRLGKTPPPVFTDGPPPVTQLEATGPGGAVGTFDAPVAVDYNGNTIANATCSPASGSTFPLGVTHGTCTATDSNNRTSAIRFRVRVKDTTPPVLSNVPANITVSGTSPSGAIVIYTPPTATDTVDSYPTVTCAKASGANFPFGNTTVTCTAKDASGNKSQATFTVTVNDTTPPVFTQPANVTAEATSAAGAVARFSKPAVTDVVDNSPSVVCTPASGSTFALGVTDVSCIATDKQGATATTSFTVTVQDTTAPKIASQATITASATSASGAAVSYTPPTWTDVVSGTGSANCLPASGSTFAIGTTTVNCSATDGAGNTSHSSFNVKVGAGPVFTADFPTSIYYQTNRATAVVTYPLPTATDVLDPNPTVKCTPASGSSFPQGQTTVTCTAKDSQGYKTTATFYVIVTIPD